MKDGSDESPQGLSLSSMRSNAPVDESVCFGIDDAGFDEENERIKVLVCTPSTNAHVRGLFSIASILLLQRKESKSSLGIPDDIPTSILLILFSVKEHHFADSFFCEGT